jgi:hypothetical protein
MRTAWTVVLLAACALCGCAETKYFKAGSTEQDFQRALAGCRVQAAMVPPSADRDWGSGFFDAWHCVADDRELHDSDRTRPRPLRSALSAVVPGMEMQSHSIFFG